MENRRPKILYVITKSNFGGAQRYVYELAAAFSQEADVVVALGGNGALKEKLTAAGIRTIYIPRLGRNINVFAEIPVGIRLIKLCIAERPDIIHLNSSKVGGIGSLAARLTGVPRIIFTAHGWEFNNPARGTFARLSITFFSWLTILLAHQTIAVSEAMKGQMNRFPFAFRKIHVIYNGIKAIPLAPRSEARTALAERAGTFEMPADTLWVGTLAELHPVKGIETAIAAVARLLQRFPDMHYFVLGEGEYRQKLEKQIARLNINKNVHLIGYVENAPQYLSAFDMFLLPSHSEGLSYALLEAGAAGLPTIATRTGGIPEVIANGENGLLAPQNDVEALATMLQVLAQDLEKRRVLGTALRTKVARQFSFEQMVSETRRVYELT